MTRRRCPCARIIEAEDDPASIALAVAYHQREPEHRSYRLIEEARSEPVPSYQDAKAELVTRLVRVA